MSAKQTRPLNLWDAPQVKRAETTWGHKFPDYTQFLFFNASDAGNKFLDLGCGFGRFLEYLTNAVENFGYVGYDSSIDMIKRIRERFPECKNRIYHRDITEPVLDKHVNSNVVIISSAVLIHITIEDQNKILQNLLDAKPLAIGFDINCLPEKQLKGEYSIERVMQPGFRMTWQSFVKFEDKISNMFGNDYHITSEQFKVGGGRFKHVFFLRRSGL